MLSWKEFDRLCKCNPEYAVKERTTRRQIYNEYLKEEKMTFGSKKDKMKELPPIAKTDFCAVECKVLADYGAYTVPSGSVMTTNGWEFPAITLPSYGAAHTHTYSLGNTAPSGFQFGLKQEEGNNPMNYATATVQAGTTETQDQRKYLSQRLEEIYYELYRPLEAKFGLTDDEAPSTPKELKERIASGKFTILGLPKDEDDEDEFDDGYFYGSWHRLLKWCDPAKKSDSDGYLAAVKELQALRQKTLDIIKIDEPKAGLDAIKALEAWEPTGAAN